MGILFLLFIISQPTLKPGWPMEVPFLTNRAYYGGIKSLDIDGDGEKEIFVVVGNEFSPSLLYGLRIDGSILPGFPVEVSRPPYFSFLGVAVGKINQNSPPAICLGTDNYHQLIPPGDIQAWDIFGDSVWSPPYLLPRYRGLVFPLTLHDIDGDGFAEILVHRNSIILSGNGEVWGAWEPDTISVASRFLSADLNNDSIPEIIAVYRIGENLYSLYVWDVNKVPLPGWPITLDPASTLHPSNIAIADIDNDNNLEIVLPANSPIGPSDTAYLFVLRYDGSELPGFPLVIPYENFNGPPAIGDIDNDGELEMIFSGIFDVVVVNSDGSFYSFPADYVFQGNEPAIADVDGDGDLEIVMGTDHIIQNMGRWHAYNLDGSEPQGWPLSVYGFTVGTPLIDDLDADGLLELAVLTYTSPIDTFDIDTVLIWVFDLPAPFDSARVPWGQYAHDLWNSGIYGFNPPVSVAEKTPLQIPTSYQVVYRNGIPELIFTLRNPQTIQLNLYDVTGRMLWWNVSRYPSGIHRLKLPGNIPSGLHILKVKGDQKKVLKVIKLR